jgi:hypothetical protein
MTVKIKKRRQSAQTSRSAPASFEPSGKKTRRRFVKSSLIDDVGTSPCPIITYFVHFVYRPKLKTPPFFSASTRRSSDNREIRRLFSLARATRKV